MNEITSTMKNLKKIKFLIMDVDGVLTYGGVYVNENGEEYLRFSRIDGKGLSLLREAGIRTGVISAEKSGAVAWRLKKLKIDYVKLGVEDKLLFYEKWKKELGLQDENIAFCGDDIQDLSLMQKAGISCAPCNAQGIVKNKADYVSGISGGRGFAGYKYSWRCENESYLWKACKDNFSKSEIKKVSYNM